MLLRRLALLNTRFNDIVLGLFPFPLSFQDTNSLFLGHVRPLMKLKFWLTDM